LNLKKQAEAGGYEVRIISDENAHYSLSEDTIKLI